MGSAHDESPLRIELGSHIAELQCFVCMAHRRSQSNKSHNVGLIVATFALVGV